MTYSFPSSRSALVAALVLLASGLWTGSTDRADGQDAGAQVKPVIAEKLPNVPGKSITAVVVSYAPGGKSPKHRHAGSVFASVLSGSIRSENSATGPAKVHKAGESFFEPPGSEHLVSENASATEPASLLAVFVADDGARLTTFDR
jgi:quercetin dioxygenase-like cupin family protein